MASKPRALTKADYEALAAFRHVLRQFLRFSETAAAAAGLTPQQHQALLAIKGFPGREQITIGELAERLQIQHHSAVGLADRLVREKHARRVPGTRDRRQVHLELTKRGESVLEQLSASHREQLGRIGPELSRLLEVWRGVGDGGSGAIERPASALVHPAGTTGKPPAAAGAAAR